MEYGDEFNDEEEKDYKNEKLATKKVHNQENKTKRGILKHAKEQD